MIVRRVPPKATRAGGFRRLGQYVIAPVVLGSAPAPESGVDALGSYIADQARHADRVEWTRVTNCQAATVRGAISEIDATQALNTRSKADPNYHLVIAFPPGEVPTREQIEDIEDTLVRGLGLGEHQRISALHNDKAHLHLHVAINLIHPETVKAAKIFRDHTTLAQLAAGLEIKHGLERTSHDIPNDRNGRTPDAAKTMEAHTGTEPFVEWVRRVAGAELIAAAAGEGGWQQLHETASRYGLDIRQRGAGLIIGKADEPALMMKASDLDRQLGYKRLVDRHGQFVPASEAARSAERETEYVRAVPPERREDQTLWARYSEVRERAIHDRALALADHLAAGRRFRDAVQAHYRAKFGEIKRIKITMGIDPRTRYEVLKRQQAALLARHRAEMKQKREAINARHAVPSWPDWLRTQAETGNRDAVTALRSMATSRERFAEAMIRSPQEAGRVVSQRNIKPKASRNGDMTWRLPDGGAVVQTKTGLSMPTPSRAAAVLALEMAMRQAPGQPLYVDGTTTQRQALLDAAVLQRLDVRFADPSLERERDRRVRELDDAEGWTAPAKRADTIADFINRRNIWPDPGDTTHYRTLDRAEAGSVEFVATLRLRGVDVALWRDRNLTYVADITGQPEDIAYRLSPGDRADLATIRENSGAADNKPVVPPPSPERGQDAEYEP